MNGNDATRPKLLDSRKLEEKAEQYVIRVGGGDTDRGAIALVASMLKLAYMGGYRDCERDREDG